MNENKLARVFQVDPTWATWPLVVVNKSHNNKDIVPVCVCLGQNMNGPLLDLAGAHGTRLLACFVLHTKFK